MTASYLAQLQNNPGWFAINVLVPVLLPFAVIAAVATATGGWRLFVRMLKKSIDGGQLFWVALGMMAATGYDAFSAYQSRPHLRELIGWTLGSCVVGAFFSSIFIAVNTARTSQSQTVSTRVIWISVLVTIVMSYFYPLLHFTFSWC
ncbi:hypothetical protein [Duganella levis]|uniref:Uncharacterized protein n=1 Tax=Duganella levis TaxID=2692169 RepID=A0ABW9W7K5_9BURK|nr:hypothetical protein [Duganella levis]MYN30056.1 hypothetical protein [Duganella levis]